jgi:L-rhamnose-H+ transport protein
MSNPLIGTGLHAIGGISAASCYLPYRRTQGWHWTSFWLVQSVFAWIFTPLLLAVFTVPDFFGVLQEAPSAAVWSAFLLGAAYGFGGLSFGFATQKIGYSLTYTLSIGMSAILGTIIPLLFKGGLSAYFARPGGSIILAGMLLSLVGIAVCGLAGFRKEKETGQGHRQMRTGLLLTIVAGVLSAVFNVSLEAGQPIADLAARKGAGIFEGNAKLVVSTTGCFVVNAVWFITDSLRHRYWPEMLPGGVSAPHKLVRNYSWSALAGVLWCLQFFFYGLGHVNMGHYQFASWVIHMSMLIFFSYIVGMLLQEWRVSRPVFRLLLAGLLLLLVSFCIISYGTAAGDDQLPA